MPRIRQKAEQYAAADLKAELNAQRARFGLHTFALFGGAIGVSAKTAWNYCNDPDSIRMKELRAIVKTIKPDPEVILKALGYSSKEIRSMANVVINR